MIGNLIMAGDTGIIFLTAVHFDGDNIKRPVIVDTSSFRVQVNTGHMGEPPNPEPLLPQAALPPVRSSALPLESMRSLSTQAITTAAAAFSPAPTRNGAVYFPQADGQDQSSTVDGQSIRTGTPSAASSSLIVPTV